MSTNVGIWIDHRQATLVLVTEAGVTLKKIASGVEEQALSRTSNPGHSRDVVDDVQDRKHQNQLRTFYDEVIGCLTETTTVLVIGPGEAKGEFYRRLTSKHLSGLTVEIETAARMTDRELTAKVSLRFPRSSTVSADVSTHA